jgi:mannose-6-phosphate isomerase
MVKHKEGTRDMQPLFFPPILKRIRWGGRRLGMLLGKPIGPESDYAESWEVVDHGNDQSTLAHGPLAGWTLQRIVQERNAELFGKHAGISQFPLLVKFLDANDRLSLQVHPNDVQAKTFDPAENGKTEAWVIVHAEPRSQLYAGLKTGVGQHTLREYLGNGRLEDCLHMFEVSAGDCVFIPAGTVHAIAEGIVLAEIQQSSDLTFRLHDWGRLGSDGKPRPLHIEQSLSCIDFTRGPVSPIIPQKLSADGPTEKLVECEYFAMHRHQITQPFSLPVDDRFHVLMMLAGSADLSSEGRTYPMLLGQTALIPAACADVKITPHAGSPCIVLDAFSP